MKFNKEDLVALVEGISERLEIIKWGFAYVDTHGFSYIKTLVFIDKANQRYYAINYHYWEDENEKPYPPFAFEPATIDCKEIIKISEGKFCIT